MALNKNLREESRYATGLEKGGEFGRAKLARAAIDGVKLALKTAAMANDKPFDIALRDALTERRADYNEYWNDPDGVGTSTFFRALNLVDED